MEDLITYPTMDSADPKKNFNPAFKTQLFEARAEWLRRYPKGTAPNPFHKMKFIGSTVLVRLDDGREVIAKITATDNQPRRCIVSFGTPVKTEPAQIIKII